MLNSLKKALHEIVNRYGYPLIIGTLTELFSAILVFHFSENLVISAIAAAIGGNLGFYYAIAYKDAKELQSVNEKISMIGLFKVVRNLFLEFGPAEYLDSYVIRPILFIIFPSYITPYFLGAIVASVFAELIFFGSVFLSYKTRKKIFND